MLMMGVQVVLAPFSIPYLPLSDSLSLVSRQSDLATYAAEIREKQKGERCCLKSSGKMILFFHICKFWRAKNTFLCKKRARICIYQKKIVILQRKMCKQKNKKNMEAALRQET